MTLVRIKCRLWQRKLLEREREPLNSYLEVLQESFAVRNDHARLFRRPGMGHTDIHLSEALEPACKRNLQHWQHSIGKTAACIDSFDGLAQQVAPADYVLWRYHRILRWYLIQILLKDVRNPRRILADVLQATNSRMRALCSVPTLLVGPLAHLVTSMNQLQQPVVDTRSRSKITRMRHLGIQVCIDCTHRMKLEWWSPSNSFPQSVLLHLMNIQIYMYIHIHICVC